MSKLCRHCGKVIIWAMDGGFGGYWYHPVGQSVYCDASATKRAEPRNG